MFAVSFQSERDEYQSLPQQFPTLAQAIRALRSIPHDIGYVSRSLWTQGEWMRTHAIGISDGQSVFVSTRLNTKGYTRTTRVP